MLRELKGCCILWVWLSFEEVVEADIHGSDHENHTYAVDSGCAEQNSFFSLPMQVFSTLSSFTIQIKQYNLDWFIYFALNIYWLSNVVPL